MPSARENGTFGSACGVQTWAYSGRGVADAFVDVDDVFDVVEDDESEGSGPGAPVPTAKNIACQLSYGVFMIAVTVGPDEELVVVTALFVAGFSGAVAPFCCAK